MAKVTKTLEKMRRNPREWRIEDVQVIATKYALEVRKPGGSHVIFFHRASGKQLAVPAKRPIKPVYIAAFLALIDEIGVTDE